MTKEQAIAILSNEKRLCKPYVKKKMGEDLVYEALDMAIKALEQQPSDETIKYLECNDIDVQKFTESMKKQRLQVIKPNICDDCVSRQAVVEYIKSCGAELGHDIENESVREDILNMPPVTPAHCIAEVRFSKEDLREICNERIEIECTHGICKHCHNAVKNYGNGRIYCVFSNCIYDEDFYCKEFKKRGNLDGSN